MSILKAAALAGAAGALCAALALGAAAQEFNDKPLQENWWPTEWGPDDKVGAPNRTTPEIVLKAVGLVKQGKTATLGKLYASDIPFFGARGWRLNIPGTPTGGPFGSNGLVFHDELVTAEIGQVGTQFDGPGHIGVRTSEGDLFYNGRNREETYKRGPGNMVIGMGDLGVESVAEKGFVCRGVLLDATKLRGTNPLPIPTATDSPGIVTADDVKGWSRTPGSTRSARATACSCTPVTAISGRTANGRRSRPRRSTHARKASSSPASRASGVAPASISPNRRSF